MRSNARRMYTPHYARTGVRNCAASATHQVPCHLLVADDSWPDADSMHLWLDAAHPTLVVVYRKYLLAAAELRRF
jgi:hypothetical protein